jgi:hypothetical protein
VSRPLKSLVAGIGVLLVAGPLSSCGGSADKSTSSETNRAVPGAEARPPRLSRPDRKAVRDIQKSSGDLRAAVTPVAYGSSNQILAKNQLSADISSLNSSKPRNSLLRRLRTRALHALQSAVSSSPHQSVPPKDVATAAIAEADRIDAGLRRYAASHPAANEIAPG